MNIERRKKAATDLNIAPLIDVVFQLLLFFALTSYFIAHPGIEVSLPRADSAVAVQKDHIIIAVTRENEVYCNNQKVELSQLKETLESMDTSKTVILKADKNIQLGLVVQVIDIIKQTDIKDLVIATSGEGDDGNQQ